MAARFPRSLGLPIILSSVSVAASIALIVGWVVVFARTPTVSDPITENRWLLVGGIVALAFIITALVMFGVFLSREILEVRRQTTFIDSVTHELKSPLASLQLGLETLERTELVSAQKDVIRTRMRGDIERLAAFIDDVLEASRISHGRAGHVVESFALAPAVRRAVEVMARRHHVDPARFVADVSESLVLHTDPVALAVVLRNLLDNAVKYSPPEGEVTIRATQNDAGELVLEVRDQGLGIEPKDLRRVFERFYRAPSEAVRVRRGTGLGLFVVAELVKGLGGRVMAESAGIGKGTTLRVSLPAGSVLGEEGAR